jgi:hypothetical protein
MAVDRPMGGYLKMPSDDFDDRLRSAAFAYLDGLTIATGGVVSYKDLEAFEFDGRRIALIQRMRGIRKVSGLEAALSILTTYAARPQDRPTTMASAPMAINATSGAGRIAPLTTTRRCVTP